MPRRSYTINETGEDYSDDEDDTGGGGGSRSPRGSGSPDPERDGGDGNENSTRNRNRNRNRSRSRSRSRTSRGSGSPDAERDGGDGMSLRSIADAAGAEYDQFADVLVDRGARRQNTRGTDRNGRRLSAEDARKARKEATRSANREKAARAKGIVEDLGGDGPDSYTLYRNMRHNVRSAAGGSAQGDKLKDWTENFITPVERSCMVKQMTQCTDPKRLTVLMEKITDDVKSKATGPVGESALAARPQFYEVVSLVKAEKQMFHSQVGSIGAALLHLKVRMGERKGAGDAAADQDALDAYAQEESDLKQASSLATEQYSQHLGAICEWMAEDSVVPVVFPHSALTAKVRVHLEDNFEQDELPAKSLELRKRVMGDILSKVTGITREALRGFGRVTRENLADPDGGQYGTVAFANYLKCPGDKKQRTLELQNSTLGTCMQYEELYGRVCVKKMLQVLRSSSSPQVKSLADEHMNVLVGELYRSTLADINGTFAEVSLPAWKEVMRLIMWSGLVPHPVAQSTYRVAVTCQGEDQVANMLMWPDRLAYSYEPSTARLEPDALSVKHVIYTDHLDSGFSAWNHDRRAGVLGAGGAQTMKAAFLEQPVLQAVALMEARKESYATTHEAMLLNRLEDAQKAMVLDCGRSPNLGFAPAEGTNPAYDKMIRGLRDNQGIWDRQMEYKKLAAVRYLNRVQRSAGMNAAQYQSGESYAAPEGGLEAVDEFVYDGSLSAHADDTGILGLFGRSGPSTEQEVQSGYPSEYSVYLCTPPETSEAGISGGTPGSMISYKVSSYPGDAAGAATLAGSAATFDLHERKGRDRRHIWFKDRFLMRKKEKSNKQEKELEKFSGTFADTVELSVIVQNNGESAQGTGVASPAGYTFDLPAWVLLVFKMISSLIYKLGEGPAMGRLLVVDLDTVKLFGVEENMVVYVLRRFFDFGLCIPSWAQAQQGSEPFYRNADGSGWYDYDYVYQNYRKRYKAVSPDGSRKVHDVTPDVTGPLLVRPCPSNAELFGMFQFTMNRMFVGMFDAEYHRNLFDLLYSYQDMKSGNLKETHRAVPGLKNDDRAAERFDPSDVMLADPADGGDRGEFSARYVYSGPAGVDSFVRFCAEGQRPEGEGLSNLERYLSRPFLLDMPNPDARPREAPRAVETGSTFNTRGFPRTGGIPVKLWRKLRVSKRSEVRELARANKPKKQIRDVVDPLLEDLMIDKNDPHLRKVNERLLAEKDADLARSFYPDALSAFAVHAMEMCRSNTQTHFQNMLDEEIDAGAVFPTPAAVSDCRADIMSSAEVLLEARMKTFDEVRSACDRLQVIRERELVQALMRSARESAARSAEGGEESDVREAEDRAIAAAPRWLRRLEDALSRSAVKSADILPEEKLLVTYPNSDERGVASRTGELAMKWSALKRSARRFKVLTANLLLMSCFWAKYLVESNLLTPPEEDYPLPPAADPAGQGEEEYIDAWTSFSQSVCGLLYADPQSEQILRTLLPERDPLPAAGGAGSTEEQANKNLRRIMKAKSRKRTKATAGDGMEEVDLTSKVDYDRTVEITDISSDVLTQEDREFVGMDTAGDRTLPVDAADDRIAQELCLQLTNIAASERFKLLGEFPLIDLYIPESADD